VEVTECFRGAGFCGNLSLRMSKSTSDGPESGFRNPPLWIHVSEVLLAPREAKKRAVIRLIDKVKNGTKIGIRARPKKPGSDPNPI